MKAVGTPLTHRMRAGRGLSPCPILEFVSGWVCRGELRGSSSRLLAQLCYQVQEGQTATVKGRGPGKAAHSPRTVNFHRRRLAPGRRVRRSPGRRQQPPPSWQRSVLKGGRSKSGDLQSHIQVPSTHPEHAAAGPPQSLRRASRAPVPRMPPRGARPRSRR